VRRLSIGFVAPGYATPEDPGLPAVTDLVTRLALDHEVRIVALRHPRAGPPYRLGGATVHPLGGGTASGPTGRARLLGRAMARIRALDRQHPFDVLHGLWADEAGTAAAIAGRLLARPVVASVLGGELVALPDIGYGTALGRGGRWTVAAALRGANLVSVGSSTVRDIIADRVPAVRIELMPLGVDTSVFSMIGPRRAPRATILHIGSLEPVKDQVTLLRAFARLAARDPDARLVICGDGSLRRGLQRLAVRLAIDDAVDFRGHIPRHDLPDVYRSATLLAVSSRWEAQSMVAVEAAACGVPIVGTRVGSLPDLGDGAATVPVGDHVSLADAMADVVGDAARQQRMSRAARAASIARYDLDGAVTAWCESYTRLAS
jgi:glycosyltransferase involved in cell wall biosynthesis